MDGACDTRPSGHTGRRQGQTAGSGSRSKMWARAHIVVSMGRNKEDRCRGSKLVALDKFCRLWV